ncbi:MAG: hypothetical protein WAX79_05845 [Candidatus Omnitrophota bacterium]
MSKKFFTLPNIISVVVISSLSAGVFLVFADWSAPPTAAPNCPASEPGCNLPLNVSGAGQIKAGGLTLGANLNPSDTGLIILNGNVGIGTTAPGQKLTVAGTIEATGGFKFPDATTQTTAFNGNADTVDGKSAGATAIYVCPQIPNCSVPFSTVSGPGSFLSSGCIGQLSTVSTCTGARAIFSGTVGAGGGLACSGFSQNCAIAGYLLAP